MAFGHSRKDVEITSIDSESKYVNSNSSQAADVRLDKRGIPVVPQPTADPLDPLNWSLWLKILVLLQVSLLAFVALFSASLITPAFVPLSKSLHKDITETAYVTSVFIAFVGASSLFWNPIANVYGRRPIYIISISVAIATSAASGASSTYGELIAFRALNGFFGGVALGLGSATVTDLFFEHERGFYMGIYTLSLITGGHIAPIAGGYIVKNTLTWHWCFYIPAIITAFMLPLFIFTVPETLYSHSAERAQRPYGSWMENMTMRGKAHSTRSLKIIDFFRPIQMLMYPSVLLPTLYYSVSFGYGSILFIITSANIFLKVYKYKPYQTGVLLGVPLTVGSVIGELVAGGLSDWISEKRALARGGARKPEDRLLALFPAIVLLPLGIIIEGVCLTHNLHAIGTGFGIAIASFGLQIATTVVYTYTAECYRQQAAEIGSLLNFGRQLFGFAVGFYAVKLGTEVGFQNAWITFAFINFAVSLPVLALIFVGGKWRHALGRPGFHRDL